MSLLSENIFINGSFDVWLNGTEFTDISSTTEVAGKWFVDTVDGTLGAASLSESVPDNSVCENSLELSNGDEDMSVDVLQRIDARYAAQLQRIVVFSAMIYNGTASAFTPLVKIAVPQEDEGQWGSTTQIRSASLQECAAGAWTKVVLALDLSDEDNLAYGCEFRIRFTPFVEGDVIRVTAMKLESRDMATPFTRRFYDQELTLCRGGFYLDTALFDQDNTLLKADTANTPISLVVGENTLVGNTGGGIAALTAAQAMPLWAALPDHYERDQIWAKSGSSNTILLSPHKMTVNINDVGFYLAKQRALDLSDAASWDNTTTDYTVAATRAGLDFCVYACNDSGALKLLLSRNATFPVDSADSGRWTVANTRKIGGFHCLCADVGTIANHPLSGYVAGDILPASVWDLKHRPVCDPAGMVYCEGINKWVDIYLASVSDGALISAYNGTIADGASTKQFHHLKFSQWFGKIGKRLPTLHDFVALSLGSNQGTEVNLGAIPDTTGGHSDINSQRMISHCGCEDCCGALMQWGDNISHIVTSAWTSGYNSYDSDVGGYIYNALKVVAFGGSYSQGSYCGSRCIDMGEPAVAENYSGVSARGIADNMGD